MSSLLYIVLDDLFGTVGKPKKVKKIRLGGCLELQS